MSGVLGIGGAPLMFVTQDGHPMRFFVDAGGDIDSNTRRISVRKIQRRGGTIVHSPSESQFIIVWDDTSDGQVYARTWSHEGKIVLTLEWVNLSLREGRFVGPSEGWGGCRVGITDGDIQPLAREGVLDEDEELPPTVTRATPPPPLAEPPIGTAVDELCSVMYPSALSPSNPPVGISMLAQHPHGYLREPDGRKADNRLPVQDALTAEESCSESSSIGRLPSTPFHGRGFAPTRRSDISENDSPSHASSAMGISLMPRSSSTSIYRLPTPSKTSVIGQHLPLTRTTHDSAANVIAAVGQRLLDASPNVLQIPQFRSSVPPALPSFQPGASVMSRASSLPLPPSADRNMPEESLAAVPPALAPPVWHKPPRHSSPSDSSRANGTLEHKLHICEHSPPDQSVAAQPSQSFGSLSLFDYRGVGRKLETSIRPLSVPATVSVKRKYDASSPTVAAGVSLNDPSLMSEEPPAPGIPESPPITPSRELLISSSQGSSISSKFFTITEDGKQTAAGFWVQPEIKERTKLIRAINRHGGRISHSMSDCHYVVVRSSLSDTSKNRSAELGWKHGRIVVKPTWIEACVAAHDLVPIGDYLMEPPLTPKKRAKSTSTATTPRKAKGEREDIMVNLAELAKTPPRQPCRLNFPGRAPTPNSEKEPVIVTADSDDE